MFGHIAPTLVFLHFPFHAPIPTSVSLALSRTLHSRYGSPSNQLLETSGGNILPEKSQDYQFLWSLWAEKEKEEAARRAQLNDQQRREENSLRHDYEDGVLRGRTAADISHAGEALPDDGAVQDVQNLLEGLQAQQHKLFGRRRDYRSRRDHTQTLVDAFNVQMPAMVEAYLAWSLDTAEHGLTELFTHPGDAAVDMQRVYVVDLFTAYFAEVPITQADEYVASAYVRQGLTPAAAVFPSVVITVRVLEVFRRLQLRCPRLGVQAFVRALCDLHGVAPRNYLATQFSVAFDVCLAIRATVEKSVQKLEGEVNIPLPFLATIDGNNSLKRFWRREREVDVDGSMAPGVSKERLDTRATPGDYYLLQAEVDRWAKEGLEDLMQEFVPGAEEEDEGGGCTERWQNMKEDTTACTYRMYDETSIFPALCRHRFVLVVVDMVKSGEAKYGFAIAAHLLRVLGEVGLGYDIGCKFAQMMRMHPALSKLAADNNFKALVGTFHGHAHNRCCQLSNLTTYVHGIGLEDWEGCEKFFSKSNALATMRHATVFHRQQAITSYLKHADTADAYQGLSLLLASKYRCALKIKGTAVLLWETMLSGWASSRGTCAGDIRNEMKYYQKLVNLRDLDKHVQIITKVGLPMLPADTDTTYAAAASQTRWIETQRRHAIETRDKTQVVVEDLEIRLGIVRRWEDDGEDWIWVAKMATNRCYQRAIDALEGLVVARMFELSKVNMSDTGYKLCKHIAKALQARSKCVKSALERYNDAAAAMSPAPTQLSLEQIVDYAFLADFDLLRDGREDIRSEPWAQPAGCVAMDQHFKLFCADKEIARLNLEIPRLVTHMVDEDTFLIYQARRLVCEGNPALAHQVTVQRMERGCFNTLHMEQLVKLSKEPSFTASLIPGVSVNTERRVPTTEDIEMLDVSSIVIITTLPEEHEADVDPDADVDVELLADTFERIMVMSHNP
ncbi:hypothetical protein C8F04DRAFT_1252601 [Mycena alexandri]|uniref:Uncharacterized protein n=1 Tax=Mycena alexandri TaxID=1745969 RepID=A0AAD6T9K5_9AGAR|nr:hypothetical protein C8F04DRAFT_1252601 [Mycena alexandri]